jgi:hypothetical protein
MADIGRPCDSALKAIADLGCTDPPEGIEDTIWHGAVAPTHFFSEEKWTICLTLYTLREFKSKAYCFPYKDDRSNVVGIIKYNNEDVHPEIPANRMKRFCKLLRGKCWSRAQVMYYLEMIETRPNEDDDEQ